MRILSVGTSTRTCCIVIALFMFSPFRTRRVSYQSSNSKAHKTWIVCPVVHFRFHLGRCRGVVAVFPILPPSVPQTDMCVRTQLFVDLLVCAVDIESGTVANTVVVIGLAIRVIVSVPIPIPTTLLLDAQVHGFVVPFLPCRGVGGVQPRPKSTFVRDRHALCERPSTFAPATSLRARLPQ
ncbi:hypothetical protein DFH07DRAFT_357942 [Mycena maculata]|uniref:Uncharacterized protein n=1 Tax=Mycena maculata TaxID=230809 RepID=A0AAD7NL72_9AGAR|nr:hypothetical protein DFH07DRAFT_357942 [Mycena maculata]